MSGKMPFIHLFTTYSVTNWFMGKTARAVGTLGIVSGSELPLNIFIVVLLFYLYTYFTDIYSQFSQLGRCSNTITK